MKVKGFLCGVAAAAGLAGCGKAPEIPDIVEIPTAQAHCVDAPGAKHIDLIATASGHFLGRAERPAAGAASALYDPVFNRPLGATLGLEGGYAVVDRGFGPAEKYACASQSLTLKP